MLPLLLLLSGGLLSSLLRIVLAKKRAAGLGIRWTRKNWVMGISADMKADLMTQSTEEIWSLNKGNLIMNEPQSNQKITFRWVAALASMFLFAFSVRKKGGEGEDELMVLVFIAWVLFGLWQYRKNIYEWLKKSQSRTEKLIIVVTAIALVILFLWQADTLGEYRFLLLTTSSGQPIGLRGNLIIQTIFYALSILIAGGTLIYFNRERK